MDIYLLLTFSSFCFSFLELFTDIIRKKFFKIIQYFYIFLLSIIFIFNRENSDYNAYLLFFKERNDIVHERGYLIFTDIIRLMNGNHNIVILILGLLMIYTFFYLYKSHYIISYIFLYSIFVLIFDINQIRNLYCILFILIGIKFLSKKKDIAYLLLNFLAISFQRLGLIYLIFYILQKFTLKTYIKFISIIFISSLLLQDVIINYATNIFPDKIFYYLRYKQNMGHLLYYFLILMDVLFLLIAFYKNKKKLTILEKLCVKFILFPIIALPFSSFVLELIIRLWRNSMYIKWYYYLKFLRKDNKKQKNFLLWSLLLFQQLTYIFILFYSNKSNTIYILKQIGNIKFYF